MMSFGSRVAIAGLAGWLLAAPGATAQPDPPAGTTAADAPPEPQRRFETVVVTASRQDEAVAELPVTVHTFERDEIERSTATTVTEFLSERGVAFFSTWTPAQTSINIRGAATDGQGRDIRSQVVVLINGRRAGTANVSKLGLADVQRIEVLRGPGSFVFGSQALGGVINLITKNGLGAPGAYVRIDGGSWGQLDTVGQYGGTAGRWDYFVSAHAGRRGDYEAGADAVESPMRNTAYQQGGGMVVLGYTPDDRQRVTVTARTDGMYDAGFRGSSWDWDNDENRTNQSIDLTYTGQRPDGGVRWDLQGSFFRDLDDLRWGAEVTRSPDLMPRPGVDLDNNRRRQTGVGLRGATTIRTTATNRLQIGVDTEWSRLRNTRTRVPLPGLTASQVAPFDNNSNSRNLGVFIEDSQQLLGERLIVRGGVRFDAGQHALKATPNVPNLRERTEPYHAVTYRAGATVRPTAATAIRFNVGTGYRAPTPTELAVDYTTVLGNQIVGNPDLEPERGTSVEVGAAAEIDRFWVDLALFRNDITNRITAIAEPPSTVRVFQNRNESEIVGLELQTRIRLATLGHDAVVSFRASGAHHFRMRDLDAAARNLSTDRIIRMYETQGTGILDVTSQAWSAQLVATFYGPVWYDTEENLVIPFGEPSRGTIHRKGPFSVWQLRGRRRLGQGLWLTAAVTNLFNKNEHPLFIAINKAPLLANTSLSNGGLGNSIPGRGFVVGFELRP